MFVVWCVYNKEFTWGTFLSQFSRVTSQFFKLNACYPVGLLQQGLKEGEEFSRVCEKRGSLVTRPRHVLVEVEVHHRLLD